MLLSRFYTTLVERQTSVAFCPMVFERVLSLLVPLKRHLCLCLSFDWPSWCTFIAVPLGVKQLWGCRSISCCSMLLSGCCLLCLFSLRSPSFPSFLPPSSLCQHLPPFLHLQSPTHSLFLKFHCSVLLWQDMLSWCQGNNENCQAATNEQVREEKREREREVKGGQVRDMNMKQWHCSHYWQFTHACMDTQVQCRAAAWAHKKLPGEDRPEDDSIQYISAEFSEWSTGIMESSLL